jgi:hypothetical protein
MGRLAEFRHLSIDWDMTPEDAIVMYLEWGNNWRRGERNPVRSKNEVSNYFVLSTWGSEPVVTLVRRNSEGSEELAELPVPEELREHVRDETGMIKGVFGITSQMRFWLERELRPEEAAV